MKKITLLTILLLFCFVLCSCAAKAIEIEEVKLPSADDFPELDVPSDNTDNMPDDNTDNVPDDNTDNVPDDNTDAEPDDVITYIDETKLTVYALCRVNVRLAPIDGDVYTRAEWGTALNRTGILQVKTETETQEWWRVEINENVLFVSAEYLSEEKPEIPELYDVNKKYITLMKINTYTDCDTATKIEDGQLAKDTEITVLKMSKDTDFHWAQVKLADGKTVWIIDRNMKLVPEPEVSEPEIPETVPDPVPVPTPPSTIYTDTKAYIRKGPSTSSGYIVLAQWGTPMIKKGVQGDWTVVEYNGQTGYIKTSCTMTSRTEEPPMSVINKTYTHTSKLALYTSCYMSSKVKDKVIPAGEEFFVIRASKYRGNHWTLVQLSDGSQYYIVDDYFIPYPYNGGYSRG